MDEPPGKLTHLRNVAIIAALAACVAILPGGGNAAEAVLTAIVLGFLTAIAMLGFQAYRRSEMTLAVMSDQQRATLYAGIGLIALMIAGADKLLEDGLGVVVWLVLMGLGAFAIVHTIRAAQSY